MRIVFLISRPPGTRTALYRNLVRMTVCIPAIMILALSLEWTYAQADAEELTPNNQEQSVVQHTVTGTLTTLDLKVGKGMIKTDLGKPIFFDLVRPDLFQSVSVGQHVSIVLNEQGQAVKLMETPPAELMTPPDR